MPAPVTHLAYGIDDRYLPCLVVSMYTALKRVRGPVRVTVFAAGAEFDTGAVRDLAGHFPDSAVEVRRFDSGPLAEYGKSRDAARYPAASMVPLFLPWLVEGRCLFLDADTLVLDDVAELFRTDLGGRLIGACLAYPAVLSFRKHERNDRLLSALLPRRSRMKRAEYSLLAEETGQAAREAALGYFSSGVILFDTCAVRAADPGRRLPRVDDWKAGGRQLVDMEILNRFFANRVRHLDLRWDFTKDILWFNRPYASPELWREIRAAVRNPGILHFTDIYRRRSWDRPWWKARRRYRIYRRTCAEIRARTGIDVAGMFEARA